MFQSTHPRRVWHPNRERLSDSLSFNPHTHAGCDSPKLIEGNPCYVSIHTPTQGVTSIRVTEYLQRWSFQSTHPRRVWRLLSHEVSIFLMFQSTHPRRVWLHMVYVMQWITVSIHTPTQGVTLILYLYLKLLLSFNPHTHAGCDFFEKGCDFVEGVSIHTPTQGVTLYLITYYKSANLIHCYANHHYYSTS